MLARMKRLLTVTLLSCLALLASHATHVEADEPGLLSSGPMPAWSEMTSVAVWLQTRSECRAQLRYWPQGRDGEARLTAEAKTSAAADHIANFVIKGLTPGTRYAYELYLDGRRHQLEWPLEFQTQPQWRWRGDAPDFSFTLGSCLYVNDAEFDRPGKPYGGDYELLDALAADKADFMLWLGDNVYLREPDWLTEEGIRRRYSHTRGFDKLQKLLASRHHYAIWDDHDYGPNDSDRSFRLKDQSLRVFKDYWPAPQYGIGETPGAFSRFEWADVEFFLLDDRTYRTPNNTSEVEGKTILGEAQLKWLEDALVNSIATFKVVACGNQVLNPMAPFEGFARVPHEQKRVMDIVTRNRIAGVVFLSGDRHLSELIKVTPEEGYALYDFTCSPLSSGARPVTDTDPEANNPARVPGTLVSGQRNYGKVAVTGKGKDRELVLTCHDKTGKELWQHRIAAAALKAP